MGVWIPLNLGSRPKNKDILEMWEDLERQGCKVTRACWPDAFAWTDFGIVLMSVKRYRSRHCRRLQEFFLLALAQYGVPCYTWTREQGYRKIYPSTKDLPLIPLPRKPCKTGIPDPMKEKK